MINPNPVRLWVLITMLLISLIALPGVSGAENYALPGSCFIIGNLTGFEDFQNTGVDDWKDAWGAKFNF